MQSVLRQAQSLYRRGNLVAAAALCREVLQAQPDTPHAWFLVGMIQRREGDAAAAIASIQRALGLGLRDARVRYHYAEVLIENGRLDDAAEQLELALDQKPGFGEAWHLLGRLALQRGQFAPAADKLSRALALDPSNAALRTNLGTALLEQGRHEEAISQLREAAALKPEDAAIRYNLANAFRRAGRLDEAIREYRRVGTLSPDYAPALTALGACLAEQGDLDSALAYCEKALALAPNYAEAHNNLAVTLHRMGRLQEAAERYRRALAIEPRSPRTHDNLGQVFYQMGRFEEAVQAYGEALAIAPEFDVARGNRALVHLAVGDFVKGWEDNRARELMRGPPQGLFRDPLPIDLSGKRILVLRDQGVGDEILYLRFLPQLRARGAWTAYRPDPRIAAMCARLPFIDEVVEGELRSGRHPLHDFRRRSSRHARHVEHG